jgi:AhpD family alkylhydroperoxidase
MDQKDVAKIEKIIRDREYAHKLLVAKDSKVYRSFLDLERATFSDGKLDRMCKELIAIGISIVVNCESCLEWHIKEALRAGASEDQIVEAIEVGIEMGGGPATVSSRFALKALDYHTRGAEGEDHQHRLTP